MGDHPLEHLRTFEVDGPPCPYCGRPMQWSAVFEAWWNMVCWEDAPLKYWRINQQGQLYEPSMQEL